MKLDPVLHSGMTVLVGIALGVSVGAQRPDSVIVRGVPLSDSPLVQVADVLGDSDAYAGRTVTIEGSVERVCRVKGCWMRVVSADESSAIRVTFKNYGFFVPTDSAGHQARLEGVVETTTFSRDDTNHLIAEGVALERNPDGTATEVRFVAAGVELRR